MAKFISIDVESDGGAPHLFSMVCFGAVSLFDHQTFYGQTAPLPEASFNPDALKISGFTREEHLKFDEPSITMQNFKNWLLTFNEPVVMVSDNHPAFDWQFINYYFHRFCGGNPLGHSARRIGDFAAGLSYNWRNHSSWKKLRRVAHTHNPVDDAMGNAIALETLIKKSKQGVYNG